MSTNDKRFDDYKNMIFKFKRKLTMAARNNELYPLIGDDEIATSQRIADRLRNASDFPSNLKSQVTKIHHGLVKHVWML